MKALLEYGFIDHEIIEIINKYPNIKDIDDNEIKNKINMLEYIGCSRKIIKNIIISNPDFLNKDINDIKDLINKLLSLGIQRLDITFDSNPWLLNKDSLEIDDFIDEKVNSGIDYDDVIDLIDRGELD